MMGDREPIAEAAPAPAYCAFISYSHADAAIAQKLHRKLESYKLPKKLAATYDNIRPNRQLGALFRDKEDLPAAHNLSASVQAALQQSAALIVICSPNAKQSIWVDKEIALFRDLHPDRPIFAAIIDGEPEHAFPEGLIKAGEPLAADLRKVGDGWSLGLLKLIAGIANVPLDALIQRDAQRKIRSVITITLLIAMILLAMIAMTIYAFQQRNEAQKQREAAENTIEFLFTDLREQLKGVATLRIRQSVNNHAVQYYKDQGDPSYLNNDSNERRARMLQAVGEDLDIQGQFAEAREQFLQAHQATQTLLKREPGNADRIFAHAQSEYWVGYTGWQEDNAKIAKRYWQNYLYQAKALAKAEPDSVRTLMELGYAHGNMCELTARYDKNLTASMVYCDDAIGYMQEAVKKAPDNTRYHIALANRHGWMADILQRDKQFAKAREQRGEEYRIIKTISAQNPENGELQMRLTWPQIGLANIAYAEGKPKDSIDILANVTKKIANLSQKFPDNQHIVAIFIRVEMLMAKFKKRAAFTDWQQHQKRAQQLFKLAKQGKDGEPVRRMKTLLEIVE